MLGKEAIIEFFRKKNVAHIFHLPGIHTLPLNQDLKKSDIAVFLGRHESNCGFMADGYARASGRIGVVVVTPGPGLGNVVAACMEAHGDGVPLLILHIDSDPRRWGKGVLHEIVDSESIFINFTKATLAVRRAGDLLPLLEKAYAAATTERCGPVVISIPHTLLEKKIPKGSSEIVIGEALQALTSHDSSGLRKALQGKNRPAIIGGRTLLRSGLAQQVESLCGEASIPLLTTTSGKGLISEDLPFAFGHVMAQGTARSILSRADVVIAIGTRLRETDAKWRGVKSESIIHIDVDDGWMGRNHLTDLKIVCPELSTVIEDLVQIFKKRKSEWCLEALKAVQTKEHDDLRTSPGYAITTLLRSVIPAGTTTVWDLTLISYWAEYYFPVLRGESFVTPRGTSPTFYAVPAAIGAKIARPDQPCLCVTGDGSSLPSLSELATVKKYNIPVVFLVYNNNSFGVLDEYMTKRYGLEGVMGLSNPDFVKLAQAFGIKSVRARTVDDLGRAFRKEITWQEPFVIEFDFPVFPPPWQI